MAAKSGSLLEESVAKVRPRKGKRNRCEPMKNEPGMYAILSAQSLENYPDVENHELEHCDITLQRDREEAPAKR